MAIVLLVLVLVYHMALKSLRRQLQIKQGIRCLEKMIVIWDCVVIVVIMDIVHLLLVDWVRFWFDGRWEGIEGGEGV